MTGEGFLYGLTVPLEKSHLTGKIPECRMVSSGTGQKALNISQAGLKIWADFRPECVSKQLVAQAKAKIRDILGNGSSNSFFFFSKKWVYMLLVDIRATPEHN